VTRRDDQINKLARSIALYLDGSDPDYYNNDASDEYRLEMWQTAEALIKLGYFNAEDTELTEFRTRAVKNMIALSLRVFNIEDVVVFDDEETGEMSLSGYLAEVAVLTSDISVKYEEDFSEITR